jgi:hypothetical protein
LNGKAFPSDSALAQMTAHALAIYSSDTHGQAAQASSEYQGYVSPSKLPCFDRLA